MSSFVPSIIAAFATSVAQPTYTTIANITNFANNTTAASVILEQPSPTRAIIHIPIGDVSDSEGDYITVTPSVSTEETATAVATEKTATAVATEKTATAVATEKTATAVATEKTATAVATEKTATAVATEKTATAVAAEKTATAVATEKTATAVATEKTATAVATEKTATAVATEKTATAVATEKTATAVATGKTATPSVATSASEASATAGVEGKDGLRLPHFINAAAEGVQGVRGVPGRKISRPVKKDVCMSIEDGIPANFHHDDADQFVMMDGGACKPVLPLVDNSCSAHMDIGTRCASYCQTSMFYSYGQPVDLQHGSMCREGENCEMRYQHSKSLQISNKVVDRHVKDTTISLTPGATWGFGLRDVTIPLPNIGGVGRVKRDIAIKDKNRRQVASDKPIQTGYKTIDAVLASMHQQAKAEVAGDLFTAHIQDIGYYGAFDEDTATAAAAAATANATAAATTIATTDAATVSDDAGNVQSTGPFVMLKGWFKNLFGGGSRNRNGNGNNNGNSNSNGNSNNNGNDATEAAAAAGAGGAPQQKAEITVPIPTISNPTGSLSATFTRNWLHESVHTHYRASQTGEFTSLTHKQVPGDGCGSFYLVPNQITTCGWQALPRVPRHMQEAVLNWLATATLDEIHQSDFKRGVFSADGSHKKNGRYQKQMWQIGPGGCPATYHEFPTCTNSYAKNADGSAMGRVVYVKRDCDTGRVLDLAQQARPYRESVNFDDIFHVHLLKDPRLFNPGLGHLPPLTKAEDDVVEGGAEEDVGGEDWDGEDGGDEDGGEDDGGEEEDEE